MDNSLRVLLVTADFPPDLNGVGDYTERLAASLAAEGCEVTVATRAMTDVDDRHRLYTVRREIADWTGRGLSRVTAMTRDFDIVHVQYPGVANGRGTLLNRLPAAVAKIGTRRPKTVLTLHEFRAMRARWRARASLLFRGLDAAVLVDGGDESLARRWSRAVRPCAGPPPFEVIPIAPNVERLQCHPEDRETWRRTIGLGRKDVALLYFGILYPHKGVELMLETAHLMRLGGFAIRPIVVGNFDRSSDWQAGLEARLRDDDVTWVRDAPAAEVSRVMHASDIAMLAYDSGAGPNRSSLLTALAHDLPTITTIGSATPDDFARDVPLAYIKPASTSEAVAAVTRILQVDGEKARLIRVARGAASRFSWPGVAAQHAGLYRRLTGR